MGEDRETGSRGPRTRLDEASRRRGFASPAMAWRAMSLLGAAARHGRLLELVLEPGVEATGRARRTGHRCCLGEAQGREYGRVSHLKIGFDIRRPVPPDPLTGVHRPRDRRLEARAAPEQHALRVLAKQRVCLNLASWRGAASATAGTSTGVPAADRDLRRPSRFEGDAHKAGNRTRASKGMVERPVPLAPRSDSRTTQAARREYRAGRPSAVRSRTPGEGVAAKESSMPTLAVGGSGERHSVGQACPNAAAIPAKVRTL